jgi:hypothetical protein
LRPSATDRLDIASLRSLEQNDEWAARCARYISLEAIAPLSDDPTVSLAALAA